jgi:hypothetical protein
MKKDEKEDNWLWSKYKKLGGMGKHVLSYLLKALYMPCEKGIDHLLTVIGVTSVFHVG